MGRHWLLSCPHCNAAIAHGVGYGDNIPDIWVPLIRCKVCGGLIKTGGSEYLTLTVNERTKLRANSQNNEFIEKSLDRTNNKEYLTFLKNNGYAIYPITDADKERFKDVRFDMYKNQLPSVFATQSLRNVGILIDEKQLDEKTGAFKQDVLDKNMKEYKLNRKILRWGLIIGAVVGIILGWAFSYINQYLAILGLAIGVGCMVAVCYGMDYYYKHKEESSKSSNHTQANNINNTQETKKYEQDRQQYLALIEKCGIRFFIKYYRQILHLPLKDVDVTENYSSAEREERLLAAKKIIDLGLSELALTEIIRAYNDILDKEVIEHAKVLLDEIRKSD